MQNIKQIGTFYQKDIFPEMENTETIFEERLTGKSIIIDASNLIALVGSTKNYIYLLPGGGVDDGELIDDGIAREAKEETGSNVLIEKILGRIDDFRNRDKKHNINYCAVSRVIGEKGDPVLTESEKENGLHVIWKNIDEVFEILSREMDMVKKGEINFYNTAFNVNRDYHFIKEFMGEYEK